ncbi:MAG: hypothetical protein IPN70_03040 [Candidatus Moraniibacteriota bacterium]|nr:MAG: hypothetical protein IPN70_03040 [Candidatus Moranbacteria bacterium]
MPPSLNPLPELTNDSILTLTGRVRDQDGTIQSVEYQVNSTDNSWTLCQATDNTFNQQEESFSCTIENLQDGSHTIYIRATDNVGNTTQITTSTSEQTTIDTESPDLDLKSNITLTLNGGSKTNIEENKTFSTRKERPTLKGTNKEAKNGIITIYQKTFFGSKKRIATISIDKNGKWNYSLPKKENDSRYYAIKLTDQANNASDISDWFKVIYDKTPPTFTTTLPETLTAQRGTRIDFPATDEQEGLKDQSGIEKYQVKLIGYHKDWMPTPGKNDPFFIIPEAVPYGTYPLDIKVSDKAGNHTYHTITLTKQEVKGVETEKKKKIKKRIKNKK